MMALSRSKIVTLYALFRQNFTTWRNAQISRMTVLPTGGNRTDKRKKSETVTVPLVRLRAQQLQWSGRAGGCD